MWVFDSYYKGCVELWSRERGLNRTSATYLPSFYMYLKDPSAHWEMIEGLESRFKVEECSFDTIFGSFQGHRIYASRKVAEKIEKQTWYAAEHCNVDARQDQRYLAKKTIPQRRKRQVQVLPRLRDSPEHPRDGGSRRSILSQGDLLCPVLNKRKQRFEGPALSRVRNLPVLPSVCLVIWSTCMPIGCHVNQYFQDM